jgi:NitT/TauT family transport system substrate-binding protein
MLKHFTTKLLLVVLLVLTLSPVNAQAVPTLTDLRFFLSYIPNIQFSPVYVAGAKGYFEAEGFNLLVENGDEPVGVEQIAVGDIPVGMVSGEQVILARSNGRPVVYTYQWFNKYPVAVVIPNTTPATTMAELTGLKVGIPGRFGASYSGLVAMLSANDLTENDIQVESIGFNAPDVVCVSAVDAAVVYINNEPLQLQHRADAGNCGTITDFTVIPVADTANMVSNGLVTNEELVANNPEMVAGIVRAFDLGLRDTINNPAEAYLLSQTYVENLPLSDEFKATLETEAAKQTEFLATEPDREAIAASRAALWETLEASFSADDLIQFEVLLATIDLWDAEQLGVTDEANWQLTQDVLIQLGVIAEPIDLTLAFTNAFIPSPETASE